MRFGKNNDWRRSDIRIYLNSDYISEIEENGLIMGAAALCMFGIDLKATDGSREYGCDDCKVGLLTLEQYLKYAEFIPLDDSNYWWLATPWATPNSRSPYALSDTRAWHVSTSGNLNGNLCSGSLGVRPALTFSSNLLVSVNGEDEEENTTVEYDKGYKHGWNDALIDIAHFISEKRDYGNCGEEVDSDEED
jgi:hypothetical protein